MRAASLITIASLSLSLSAPAAAGEGWPEFRGPRGDGRCEADGLPVVWGEGRNVAWKTAIHDLGWSTPVVEGEQVWLTTATKDGRRLYAVCVDRRNGKVLLDRKLFDVESPQPLGNSVNGYASPSPAIEPGRVYLHFGSYGTACLDTGTFEVLWERRDLPCNHFRGPGSSPVLHKDLLILTMDGFDEQYLCALDRKTGRTVWRSDRSFDFGKLDGDLRKAYTTPLIFESGGALQMVSSGAKAAYSYDPDTGKELWQVHYGGYSNASRPVFGQGLVFINTGFGKADLWAVRPDGKGVVTGTHVAWKCTQGVPLKPSPVVDGDLLFMFADGGIATCLEAKTGQVVWKERLGEEVTASPLAAGGRLYVFGEKGLGLVLRAGRTFEPLARNRLEEGMMASPAAAGKALFLRTKTHLYRIEEAPAKGSSAKGPARS